MDFTLFSCQFRFAAVVDFIERFQGLIGTLAGLIFGSWMIMRSHYKTQSRRESIRMMIRQIDDYVSTGERYWRMRFDSAKEEDPTALAITIQVEFTYLNIAFQSLMKKEDKEWKNMLREFFDATTGDVFGRKTKIDKDFYITKIANIRKFPPPLLIGKWGGQFAHPKIGF